MNSHPHEPSMAQNIGGTIFGLSMIFCSTEVVPGWGIFHTGWPTEVFYVIMGLAGAVAGGLIPKYPLAGIPSGALAGLGALLALTFALERVAEISTIVSFLIGVLGAIPGLGLYYGLRLIFLPSATDQDESDFIEGLPTTLATAPSDLDEVPVNPTACPGCGSEKFRKKKSEAFLAFLADRVCLDCGTRYAPPTPRWAPFIYLPVALMCFGGSAVCLRWNQIEAGRGPMRLGREFTLAVGLAVFGAICLGLGFRCFFSKPRSKVVEPPEGDRTNR